MAEPPIEPIPPPPDPPKNGGNGDTGRIDRDMTPLGGAQKVNYGAFGVLVALGLLFVLWWTGAFSTEPTEPEEPPHPLITHAPPPLPTPSPLPVDQPTPYTPPPPPEPFDDMAAERERLLLLRVQGLQKQMFERRRSKMLVVSDPAAAPAAPPPPGAAGPLPAVLPTAGQALPSAAELAAAANPNTPRVGNVGPVLEQEAVAARLLRTTAYTITEGTIIPAILETAIHSQLPGLVRALNSADVYSHDGSQLLIPKGSRLVGRYQNSIRRGQVRVFIIWTRIIRADGMSILINSPGTDPLGRAGLGGDVDTHFFQIFGAAILLSVLDTGLDIGLEMARDQGSNNTNIGQGSFNSTGLDRAGEIALNDSIRIEPTIHVDQGTRISIMVARDLDFEAVEMAREARHRK